MKYSNKHFFFSEGSAQLTVAVFNAAIAFPSAGSGPCPQRLAND